MKWIFFKEKAVHKRLNLSINKKIQTKNFINKTNQSFSKSIFNYQIKYTNFEKFMVQLFKTENSPD